MTVTQPPRQSEAQLKIRQQANPINRLAVPVPASNSALATIEQFLAPYGLQSLAQWAWGVYKQYGGGQGAQDEIARLLPQQPAYQARFPAIAARQKAGLPALSPADYLNYEASLDAELAKVGAPAQMRAGTAQFASLVNGLLTNDVSASEAAARIDNGYSAVTSADPSVRQYFADKFGVQGDSALLATFLAPEHSEQTLAQMEREAEIGGAASRAGIDLGLSTAQRVAAVNPSGSVDTQFGNLAKLAPVFQATVGEQNEPALTAADQGVAAEFGLDATSAAAIQRRLDERNAAMGLHPVITQDNQGITGTGVAR